VRKYIRVEKHIKVKAILGVASIGKMRVAAIKAVSTTVLIGILKRCFRFSYKNETPPKAKLTNATNIKSIRISANMM